VTRLTRDELLENEEALGHIPWGANIVLYFWYHTESSELLTSPAIGRETAQTSAPQAKEKKKNGGVGPKKPFYRHCIQMSVPRRLVLIEWEGTIQSDLIGSFSTLIGSFSLYTNQSECEIGWSSTKCASTCSLCFLLEYFSWVLFGLFPPLSFQSSQCI
jgi:hypothetical protein